MKKEIKIALPKIEVQKLIIKQEETKQFENIRIETRLPYREGFKQPTPSEVRLILKKLNLTGSKAGDLVGVNSRTVRKWQADPKKVKEKKSAQKIPFAAWRLLVLELERKLYG